MQKFWLETNLYFGYVWLEKNNKMFKHEKTLSEIKELFKIEQGCDVLDTKQIIGHGELGGVLNFGFKREHQGITLREYLKQQKEK